jgi:N-acetylmuramoyl-L-alanine amidase
MDRLLRIVLSSMVLFSVAAQGISQGMSRPVIGAPPQLRAYPVLSEYRLMLLREYMKLHYGIDSAVLDKPSAIVVHYTAIASLEECLARFMYETLTPDRTDIAGHGDVNVGVHYLIAKDGVIYQLQPENIVGRHAIGFNWCALGIELVAANEKELTPEQLASCAWLCAWIASRLYSVEHLFGHHESLNQKLPHYVLFRENDPTYAFKVNGDPGVAFMKKLRSTIISMYSISLKF